MQSTHEPQVYRNARRPLGHGIDSPKSLRTAASSIRRPMLLNKQQTPCLCRRTIDQGGYFASCSGVRRPHLPGPARYVAQAEPIESRSSGRPSVNIGAHSRSPPRRHVEGSCRGVLGGGGRADTRRDLPPGAADQPTKSRESRRITVRYWRWIALRRDRGPHHPGPRKRAVDGQPGALRGLSGTQRRSRSLPHATKAVARLPLPPPSSTTWCV